MGVAKAPFRMALAFTGSPRVLCLEYFIEVVVNVPSVTDEQDYDLSLFMIYHIDGSVVSYPKAVIGRVLQTFSPFFRFVF